MDFFSSLLNWEGKNTQNTSERALQSFVSFCADKEYPEGTDILTIIADWLVNLQMSGVARGTVERYLKGLSGYYTKAVKENIAPKTDAFKVLTNAFKVDGVQMWSESVTRKDFDKFLSMTKLFTCQRNTDSLAEDIIMMSLMNGQMPLSKVAMLKVNEALQMDKDSLAIVNRHREPARKYVFPLRQSMLTKRQLADLVNGLVMDYLQKRNIRCFTTADETLKSYWAYAALREGIPPHVLSSTPGFPPMGMKILSLFPKAKDGRESISEVNASSVAGIFLSNPLQWYAMRLRPRVSFTDLKVRFSQLKDELETPDMFYPCEEISKRTGKKVMFESKPIIGNIVFFRARVTDILPIFYRIGDLAWCYKYTNEQGSAYAAIPKESFIRFQQTIGYFTSDYEVAPIGALKPQVNDRVVVVGGPFQGINAVVKDINSQDENIIYRLHFIGDNGIDYRLSLDSRMVRKE